MSENRWPVCRPAQGCPLCEKRREALAKEQQS